MLCQTSHFAHGVFVAEHTTAAYLHAVGKAIQMNPAARTLLSSGKLVFYAGDTDISRPTEEVGAELKAVYERRFDMLLFHRCPLLASSASSSLLLSSRPRRHAFVLLIK